MRIKTRREFQQKCLTEFYVTRPAFVISYTGLSAINIVVG